MPCGQDHEHSEACGHGAAGLAGEEIGIAYSLYQVPRVQIQCVPQNLTVERRLEGHFIFEIICSINVVELL